MKVICNYSGKQTASGWKWKEYQYTEGSTGWIYSKIGNRLQDI